MIKNSAFDFITHTWNPMVGCLHNCVYCMAKEMAKRFAEGASYADRYSRLGNARSGSLILVCDKADLFGNWVPDKMIVEVINAVRNANPKITFVFLTKNPTRYQGFIDILPQNCMLGATIETNRNGEYEKYSKAPKPSERYIAMKSLNFDRKIIFIEPVMDFDNDVFENWIQDIAPEKCVLGSEPRLSDLMNPKTTEEEIETYCWNCKTTTKASKNKVISEVGDRTPTDLLVTYCLDCGAILNPKWMMCYLCKDYSKTFYTGMFMHAGLMYHALCKKCRRVVEIVGRRREVKNLET